MNGKLNSKGIKEITAMAADFLPLVQNKRVKIFSSTETRASDSAEIIANKLGVSFEKKEILSPNGDHSEDIFELIKSYSTVDILILMTHLEHVDFLPYDFVRKILLFKSDYDFNNPVKEGGYRYISCTKKTITTKNP